MTQATKTRAEATSKSWRGGGTGRREERTVYFKNWPACRGYSKNNARNMVAGKGREKRVFPSRAYQYQIGPSRALA